MDAFERAEAKYAKNKVRNDAYQQKVREAQEEAKKPSVKRCYITVTVCDGTEHTETWEANQLIGTVIAGQRSKQWYMSTVKELLQKPFGKLT